MDLIIPLGPDIARFDDRNLYLRTSPEDMADALSRVGPADLRTIAQASPEVASAGLEAVIEALESSDTLASMERLLFLLDRIKGAARSYLDMDALYIDGRNDRPLTADERARIVAAVGGAPELTRDVVLRSCRRIGLGGGGSVADMTQTILETYLEDVRGVV